MYLAPTSKPSRQLGKALKVKYIELNYEKRYTFIGLVERPGKKRENNHWKPTLLLTNLISEYIKEAVIDREWNIVIKLPMKDYALVYPTKIKLLNNHIAKQPVPENNAESLRYIGDVTHDLKRMKRYFLNGW